MKRAVIRIWVLNAAALVCAGLTWLLPAPWSWFTWIVAVALAIGAIRVLAGIDLKQLFKSRKGRAR